MGDLWCYLHGGFGVTLYLHIPASPSLSYLLIFDEMRLVPTSARCFIVRQMDWGNGKDEPGPWREGIGRIGNWIPTIKDSWLEQYTT